MIDFEFDHTFTVREDGTVVDADVHGPAVFHDDDSDVYIDGRDTWTPLTGYTGQYGYHGAVMHASEQFAGRLHDDVMSTPGTYVLTVVEVLPTDDDPEPEPAGWTVLRLREDA